MSNKIYFIKNVDTGEIRMKPLFFKKENAAKRIKQWQRMRDFRKLPKKNYKIIEHEIDGTISS